MNSTLAESKTQKIALPLQAKRLVFEGKQQVRLEENSITELKDKDVLIKMSVTLMSTGTENIVFNRNFDAGSHWDNWVKYPFYPGYSGTGTVVAVGKEVKKFKIGDRVAGRFRHTSHITSSEDYTVHIPDKIPFEDAAWFALGKIAFHGAQVAEYKIGDSVLVVGAGPIGQMSVRWAFASGAERIIVVDPAGERLQMATRGGATATISQSVFECKEALLEANRGKLPRVVIDTTGNSQVFSAALGLAEKFGTVVILGDTGQPTKQSLTQDVITRGLRIVGAHDVHVSEKWNHITIPNLLFSLASTNRFSLSGLNTHRFKPEQCKEAYETANRDRQKTMGILFDWNS